MIEIYLILTFVLLSYSRDMVANVVLNVLLVSHGVSYVGLIDHFKVLF